MKVGRNAYNKSVKALRPGRSIFDLSYAKKMSGKMGYLYPMMCDEVVPGDVFDLSAEAVIRFQPMVAPILHEVILKADWFFVPYRIMFTRENTYADGATLWERFITGGQLGTDASALPRIPDVGTEGELLDHLGIPPGLTLSGDDQPLKFPVYAYNIIYNEYYRDENLESLSALTSVALKYSNWDADYFTRALPFQQRGSAPALPVTGSTAWATSPSLYWPAVDASNPAYVSASTTSHQPTATADKQAFEAGKVTLADMNANVLAATSVNIAGLRTAVQLQRWLERNARSGARYTEELFAHFGIAPRDERLSRPEYIGGLRQSIVISEVLQTSVSSSTPQGNMAGHGILAGRHNIGRYHVTEYGLIMCLMSIQPRSAYQQGINRQWLRVSKYDFYWPEFANLQEQGIYNEEIYATNSAGGANRTIWGYQGNYNEMRSKQDMVAGAFRSSLNYWHLGRIFGSLPALSSTFGHVDPTTITRVFAAPSADNIYVHWGNRIRAIRPLPPEANPGRMDHDYGGS